MESQTYTSVHNLCVHVHVCTCTYLALCDVVYDGECHVTCDDCRRSHVLAILNNLLISISILTLIDFCAYDDSVVHPSLFSHVLPLLRLVISSSVHRHLYPFVLCQQEMLIDSASLAVE